jgi:hypothetical protein
MLDAIVHAIESLDPVTDPSTAMDTVEVARDTRIIAEPIPGTEEIVATARLAPRPSRTRPQGATTQPPGARRPNAGSANARTRATST